MTKSAGGGNGGGGGGGNSNDARKKASEINQIHLNAILAETIRKEMKRFHLCTEYKLTPTMKKTLVVTEKPNEMRVQSLLQQNNNNNNSTNLNNLTPNNTEQGHPDEEYLDMANRAQSSPREKYPYPVSTNQEIGWETIQLLPENFHPRYHHPRVASEITKLYATVLSKP